MNVNDKQSQPNRYFDSRFSQLTVPGLFQILVTLWTLVLACWLYRYSVLHGGPACWDGYERCAWGANIWYSLCHGNASALWDYTHMQIIWPFLHSWILGVLFLIFDTSLQTARLVCLISFVLVSFSILCFFRGEDRIECVFAGLIAWLFFTTSPYSLQHAVSVMSELPGLLLVVLVLYFFPQKEASRQRCILSGIFLGLLFYYKYNFAVLTLMGIGLAVAIQLRFNPKKLFSSEYMFLFGVLLIMLLLWFVPKFEHKWGGLIEFAFNNPNTRMPLNWQNLIYYPARVPSVYFSSMAMAMVSLLPIGWAAWKSRCRIFTHPVFLCFAVHFAAAMIHPMKDPRFVFIPMGLYFIFAGFASRVCLRTFSGGRNFTYIAYACLAVLVVSGVYQSFLYAKPFVQQFQYHVSVYQTMLDQIDDDDNVGFLVIHDYITPPAISYAMITGLDLEQRSSESNQKRWNFLFLFYPKADMESKSLDEKIRMLRHSLYIDHLNKVICIETPHPEILQRFDPVFGGTYLMVPVVDRLPEFQKTFERTFYGAGVRMSVYELQSLANDR